jgi:hypothetical protein
MSPWPEVLAPEPWAIFFARPNRIFTRAWLKFDHLGVKPLAPSAEKFDMIKWEEFEHIHVIKRLREVLGSWFHVDVGEHIARQHGG